MNKPMLSLQQALDDCEVRILAAASRSREELREAVTYAHGIAHGYFMAGVATPAEFTLASERIRDIADLGERQFETITDQTEEAA